MNRKNREKTRDESPHVVAIRTCGERFGNAKFRESKAREDLRDAKTDKEAATAQAKIDTARATQDAAVKAARSYYSAVGRKAQKKVRRFVSVAFFA